MKILIKNMVCRGTRLLVIQELEKMGLNCNKFGLATIEFEKDLSLNEINEIDKSLSKFGLEVAFRD